MRIKTVNFYNFDLPLISKIKCYNQSIYSRKGFVIELIDNYNNKGYGEISPLQGLHSENLNEIISLFPKIKKEIINSEIRNINLTDNYKLYLPPSLEFGIDMAIINLFAVNNKSTVYELLSDNYRKKIFINGLVDDDHKVKLTNKIKKKCMEGYKIIKIKVGRTNLKTDIERINSIINNIPDDIKIILDANRSWSLDKAVLFCRSIDTVKIDYIEEPLNKISDIDKFYNETNMKVGLDETLSDTDFDNFAFCNGIKIMVIKPDTIGKIYKINKIIKIAEKNNINIVLSSSFNSGLAISFLAFLSSTIPNSAEYAGLDTYKWIKKDILKNKIFNKKPEINITALSANEKDINWNLLKKIRVD